MTWEITSVGFGEFIHMALVSVVMLFSEEGGFGAGGSAVILVIFIAILYIAGRTIITAKLELTQLILLVIAFWAMFVPRVTVLVTDQVTFFSEPVENVPIGIAAPGMILTQLATFATERYQVIFDAGTGQPQFSQQRFAYPLRMMLNLRDMHASNLGPTFTSNWQNYWSGCFYPALVNEQVSMSAGEANPEYFFGQGDNFPSDAFSGLSWTTRTTTGSLPTRTTVSCQAAADGLWEDLGVDEDAEDATNPNQGEAREALLSFLEGRAVGLPDAQVQQQTENGTVVLPASTSAALNDIRLNLSGIIGGISEMRNFLAAQIMLNSAGSAAGNRFAGVESLYMTEMMERQRMATATEASGFLRMVTIMMGLFQFLFIALTPIVAVVALVKVNGGWKVYGSWLLLGLWSSSFLIIVTVIDYWAVMNVTSRWIQGQPGPEVLEALSLSGLANAYELVANTLATANTFLVAAPLITLALLTGSIYPMAALASRLSGGPDQGSQVGTTAAYEKGALQLGPSADVPHMGGASATTEMTDPTIKTSLDYGDTAKEGLRVAQRQSETARESLVGATERSSAAIISAMQNKGFGTNAQDVSQSQILTTKGIIDSLSNADTLGDNFTRQVAEELHRNWDAGASMSVPKLAEMLSGAAATVGARMGGTVTNTEAFQELNSNLQTLQEVSSDSQSVSGSDLISHGYTMSSIETAVTGEQFTDTERSTQQYEIARANEQSAEQSVDRAENLSASSTISQGEIQAARSRGNLGDHSQSAALNAGFQAGTEADPDFTRDDMERLSQRYGLKLPDQSTPATERVPQTLAAMVAAREVMLDEGASPAQAAAARGYFSYLAGQINENIRTPDLDPSGLGPDDPLNPESTRRMVEQYRTNAGENEAAVREQADLIGGNADKALNNAGEGVAPQEADGVAARTVARRYATDDHGGSPNGEVPDSPTPLNLGQTGENPRNVPVPGSAGALSAAMFGALPEKVDQMPQWGADQNVVSRGPGGGSSPGRMNFDSEQEWQSYQQPLIEWADKHGNEGISGRAVQDFMSEAYELDNGGFLTYRDDGQTLRPGDVERDVAAFVTNPHQFGLGGALARYGSEEFSDQGVIRHEVLNNGTDPFSHEERQFSPAIQQAAQQIRPYHPEYNQQGSDLAFNYHNWLAEHNPSQRPEFEARVRDSAEDARMTGHGVEIRDKNFGSADDAALFVSEHYSSPFHRDALDRTYFSEHNLDALMGAGQWTDADRQAFREAVNRDLDNSGPQGDWTETKAWMNERFGFSDDPDNRKGPDHVVGGRYSAARAAAEN